MQKQTQASSIGWRRPAWFAALVATSLIFSLGFACAVPLAAFAAIAALTMSWRAALLLILAVLFANQRVGFTVLHYPWTSDALAWGAAFALVGVLAVLAAGWVGDRAASAHPLLAYAPAFLAAFALYEGGLFAITLLTSSDMTPYATAQVVRIFAINAAAFVGLLVASRLAASAGFTDSRIGSVGMTQRPI